MKRLFIIVFVALLCATADATGYNYLVFRQADGTETGLLSSRLKITFSDGNAVAVTADGTTTTLPLSSLNTMFFAETWSSGIMSATMNGINGNATVYSVTGVRVGSGASVSELRSSLKPGVYIVKTEERTFKIQVR